MAELTAPPIPTADEVEVTSHAANGKPTDDPTKAVTAEASFGGQEYAIIVPIAPPARD